MLSIGESWFKVCLLLLFRGSLPDRTTNDGCCCVLSRLSNSFPLSPYSRHAHISFCVVRSVSAGCCLKLQQSYSINSVDVVLYSTPLPVRCLLLSDHHQQTILFFLDVLYPSREGSGERASKGYALNRHRTNQCEKVTSIIFCLKNHYVVGAHLCTTAAPVDLLTWLLRSQQVLFCITCCVVRK